MTAGRVRIIAAGSAGMLAFTNGVQQFQPVWFGALADGSYGGGGTDNTAPCQSLNNTTTTGTINFATGYYGFNGTLTITKSSVFFLGLSGRAGAQATADETSLISNSATADLIDWVPATAVRQHTAAGSCTS